MTGKAGRAIPRDQPSGCALRPLRALQTHRRSLWAGRLPLQVWKLCAAVVSLHRDFADTERFTQDLDALLRMGIPTHEDVESRIIGLGPAVNGDVALRKNCNARHATIGREVVQVSVQQSCPGRLNATLQRVLDVLEIIETASPEQVHQKVGTRAALPVTLDEVVLPVFVRYRRSYTTIFLLGGA